MKGYISKVDSKNEAIAELDKAEKTLQAAKVLFTSGFFEDSLSRCYYSVLHSAKAALLSLGLKANTHDAVKRLFGKEFVEKEIIEKEYAIILREEQDDRLLADYDITFFAEKSQAEKRIEETEHFPKNKNIFRKSTFLIAGAKGLSVSLWQVADESTKEFMVGMYRKVKDEGLSYAEAIRQMKLEFLGGKYKNPFYWAPFVYYGE